MIVEQNKTLVRELFEELINHKNLSVLDSHMAAGFVDHDPAPGLPPGPAGVRQLFDSVHQSCPDLRVTIEDIIAEGDRVVVRNTWHGTHTGLLFGVPSTGKPFSLNGIVIWRIADGRICERWATIDQLGFRRQVGAA